jgi:hypothetical protein
LTIPQLGLNVTSAQRLSDFNHSWNVLANVSKTPLSRLAIGETVFRLSVAPLDVPGFPKLLTLSEREKWGGGGLRTLLEGSRT